MTNFKNLEKKMAEDEKYLPLEDTSAYKQAIRRFPFTEMFYRSIKFLKRLF